MKKLLSLLLAAAIVFSLVPLSALQAFAAKTGGSVSPVGNDGTHTFIVVGSPGEIFGSAWSVNESNKMTLNANGCYEKTYTVDKAYTDVQLKVVRDGVNWIGDSEGKNIAFNLKGAGTFTVTIDPDINEITVTGGNVDFVTKMEYSAVYAVGNGSEGWLNDIRWDEDEPINRMTEVADDVWEITFGNVPEFTDCELKFAIDGEWARNFGGTFVRSGAESDAVYNGGGIRFETGNDPMTVKLRLDLSNFNFSTKKGAKFTVLFNPDHEDTYIVAGSNAEIFGTMWDSFNESNKMTRNKDGIYEKSYTVGCDYDDVQIKVVKNNWDWFGDSEGNNIAFNLTGAGTFTVVIDPDTNEITVTGDNVELLNDFNYNSVFAFGNGEGCWLNDSVWDPAYVANEMTEVTEDIWEIEFEHVTEEIDRQVKFSIDGVSTQTFGGDFAGSGVQSDAVYNGNEITFDTDYNYQTVKLQLDLSNFNISNKTGAKFTVTITEEDEEPTTEPPTEPPTAAPPMMSDDEIYENTPLIVPSGSIVEFTPENSGLYRFGTPGDMNIWKISVFDVNSNLLQDAFYSSLERILHKEVTFYFEVYSEDGEDMELFVERLPDEPVSEDTFLPVDTHLYRFTPEESGEYAFAGVSMLYDEDGNKLENLDYSPEISFYHYCDDQMTYFFRPKSGLQTGVSTDETSYFIVSKAGDFNNIAFPRDSVDIFMGDKSSLYVYAPSQLGNSFTDDNPTLFDIYSPNYVSFTSSDPSVVSVDSITTYSNRSAAKLNGKKFGRAVITATSNTGCSVTCAVTVSALDLTAGEETTENREMFTGAGEWEWMKTVTCYYRFVPEKDGYYVFDIEAQVVHSYLDGSTADYMLCTPVEVSGDGYLYNCNPYYYCEKGVAYNIRAQVSIQTYDWSEESETIEYFAGRAVLKNCAEEDLPPRFADIDSDGEIGVNDVMAVQAVLCEYTNADTEAVLQFGDVNRDGVVDVRDITAVQRYLAEYENPYGIGRPVVG